jgi:sulfur carrier protein
MSEKLDTPPAIAQATKIFVNDRPHALPEEGALGALMASLSLSEKKGIAVAINGTVVPRAGWATRRLEPNDRLILIQATQGG